MTSPHMLSRPRSPVYEYVYIPTQRSNLVQLIDRDNPQHRLLDEVMRLTFYEFDVLSEDDVGVKTSVKIVEDCRKPTCDVLTDRQCDNDVLLMTAEDPEDGVVIKECDGEVTEICSTFNLLNSKLDEMAEATRQMHLECVVLGQDMKAVESLTRRLLRETRRFHADVRAVRYLDDLIFMLRDQLEHITLRKWPFLYANLHEYYGEVDKLNLVV